MGVSEQTFYRWKKIYVGMGVTELRKSLDWKKKPLTVDVLANKILSLDCEAREYLIGCRGLSILSIREYKSSIRNSTEGQNIPKFFLTLSCMILIHSFANAADTATPKTTIDFSKSNWEDFKQETTKIGFTWECDDEFPIVPQGWKNEPSAYFTLYKKSSSIRYFDATNELRVLINFPVMYTISSQRRKGGFIWMSNRSCNSL